jgi:hypothetical protein
MTPKARTSFFCTRPVLFSCFVATAQRLVTKVSKTVDTKARLVQHTVKSHLFSFAVSPATCFTGYRRRQAVAIYRQSSSPSAANLVYYNMPFHV